MKIRSQVGMVLNLDKCIGCHTCSVTCKNVWTGREGMEYAWFNNVETKPGIGYPKNWEDQEEWQGGWVRDVNGKIRPRLGNKMGVITKIFANPVVPQIDDYYEPFTFDYEHLHSAPEGKHIPTARPRSLIDGKRMDKVIWGPNWEELLAEYEKVGLQLDCRELPDYLPLYLEYLSVLPDDQAKEGLLNVAPILALLGGRLKQREAPWYALFDALLQLAGSSLSSDSVTKQVNSEERDDTRQALDAVWEEEQVKFIEDNATACDSSPLNQYQRRFSQDVAPQYVDISAGGGK